MKVTLHCLVASGVAVRFRFVVGGAGARLAGGWVVELAGHGREAGGGGGGGGGGGRWGAGHGREGGDTGHWVGGEQERCWRGWWVGVGEGGVWRWYLCVQLQMA